MENFVKKLERNIEDEKIAKGERPKDIVGEALDLLKDIKLTAEDAQGDIANREYYDKVRSLQTRLEKAVDKTKGVIKEDKIEGKKELELLVAEYEKIKGKREVEG